MERISLRRPDFPGLLKKATGVFGDVYTFTYGTETALGAVSVNLKTLPGWPTGQASCFGEKR
jgi:hypothetical protein